MRLNYRQALANALVVRYAAAQFPPTPEGVTTLKSKFHEGVTISYKEPGICETTPGVRSYSGYVHLPPNTLDEPHENQDYPINTFFWFFESRKDPHNAPLAIWLNGGPGGSSMYGALAENGPCFVNADSNSTYLNPWSWNSEVNVLYIDQPNQVGFSYDTLTNFTVNTARDSYLDEPEYAVADFSNGVPEQNATFFVGTGSSLNASTTANSTTHAAVALWHFAQTWFEEFPQYKPHDEKISLFTESYGGRYGPAFVSYFMKQNELISNGTISGPGVHYLHMDTLGIINGCINFEDSALAYSTFAWNNTYGIKAFTEDQYYHAMYEYTRPGGVKEQGEECRRLQLETDPNDYGEVDKLNEYCAKASEYLTNSTVEAYVRNKKFGWFDITHPYADAFPPQYLSGYLNQHWVQKALGVPVNHTVAASAVAAAFGQTGDYGKGGMLEKIAYILDHGVKVSLFYGDRDYACNWVSGEATSIKVPWGSQDDFIDAGYSPLVISPFHSAGLTRQYGNFSFTRVYQAGHLVPSYQPEAAYEIFMRSLAGRDIATGTIKVTDEYATEGPADTWWMKSDVLPAPEVECYILAPESCTEEQRGWLKDGTAIVRDYIVIGREGDSARERPGSGEEPWDAAQRGGYQFALNDKISV
ncbi:hypothetical protein AAFC00_005968 [Neodothiora populina]|uniref:Carboxypeptidase n=1 Tax=Neodothiora populina TaxID=2781224 RepID=A0ABR3P6H6_9PEZI